MRDASTLILQFGPCKGETLAHVAMSNPDYLGQLVTRAQRPEVRAAAGRLVEALEAASAYERHAARGTSRRTHLAVGSGMPDNQPACQRCLEFQEQVGELQQRMAAAGQYVTFSPGPNPNPNVERELQRWLVVARNPSATDGFRAGWARLARLVGPRLREWEARWFRSMRENDRLRARVGSLLRELSRFDDHASPPKEPLNRRTE
jgi:hypothetical protein